MHTPLWVLLSAQLFSITVGIVSYRRKSVSVSGLVALLAISSLFVWLEEIVLLVVLFGMFASSSLLSHYKKSSKKEFDQVVAKTGPRDYIQAIANLGIATVLILAYHFTSNELLIAALLGSVAAANGDSWASEIGGVSKQKPILITTFKPVDKGISGGITYAGTMGGIAGSLFIVCLALMFFNFFQPFKGNSVLLFWSSFVAGVLGFIADSILGATVQALYKKDHFLTENAEGTNELIKGYAWINNDMVNFITTIIGAATGGLFYFLLS